MEVQGPYIKLVESRRKVDLSDTAEFHGFQFDAVYGQYTPLFCLPVKPI